ncbi:MAG TPA: ROK family transcriptional regulator [Tepidisphaeraceae bacterium]
MATSTYLRRMNQRRVIESVARMRRVSRAELARVAGMSQPTVSRIVDDLLARGILMEGDSDKVAVDSGNGGATRRAASVGRPSTPLELDRRKPRFVLLQLGVRETRLALMPIAIPAADRWDHYFDTPANPDLWGRQLTELWEGLRVKGIKAAIVSLPGVMDEQSGRVFLSPNLRWTEQADLAQALKLIFNVPILFVHEIRALALGQLALEHDTGDFLLVDSGSGVGAAAVAGGRLYTGPLPLSGELGHNLVLGNTRVCGCGATGCVETLISRNGMLLSAREHLDRPLTWPQLLKIFETDPTPAWLKRSLDAGAVAIASALNVLGLRQVVLTGALSELPPPAIDYLSDRIRADAMWARFGSITCRTAQRHRQAGMVSLAIERTLLAPRAH